jgi:hypothetical protein
MNLIRELLLKLEDLPETPGGVHRLVPGELAMDIEGHSANEVDYHLQLIEEAGFIRTFSRELGGAILFDRLTWAGHDFVDSVRSPEVWAKTRRGAEAVGGITIDLVKDLAKGFLRKQLEDLTGVKV